MRYDMLGAPQAKILWSAPSKSRFYYLFWLLELMPGHLRRSLLRILVLNPTHEISWSRSGFFSLRGRILRAGPPGPLCFLVFVFSPPPSALEVPGRPLTEKSKTLRPGQDLAAQSRRQFLMVRDDSIEPAHDFFPRTHGCTQRPCSWSCSAAALATQPGACPTMPDPLSC